DVGTGRFVGRYADSEPQFLETSYAGSEQWAKQNPDKVAKFREALNEAIEFAKTSPDEALKIQAKYLKLPEATLAKIPKPYYTTSVTPDQVGYWITLMRDLHFARGSLSPDTLIFR